MSAPRFAVRKSRPEDRGTAQSIPRWIVVNPANDLPWAFAGIAVYGGRTKSAAAKEAQRIAAKWDGEVVEATQP